MTGGMCVNGGEEKLRLCCVGGAVSALNIDEKYLMDGVHSFHKNG